MLKQTDPGWLPLLFHLNSEPWLNLDAYEQPQQGPSFRRRGRWRDAHSLPGGNSRETLSLSLARRSCRDFQESTIPVSSVATVLLGAYGALAEAPSAGGLSCLARAVPSAGGLYPLELYAAAQRVDGLPDALYHYNPLHHELEPLAEAGDTFDTLADCLLGQHFVRNVNLLIFVAADFRPGFQRYGARGYRYALIEAGHLGQNLCLVAVEEGLATLCIGGFRDAAVNAVLGLNGCEQAAVYCIAVGRAAT